MLICDGLSGTGERDDHNMMQDHPPPVEGNTCATFACVDTQDCGPNTKDTGIPYEPEHGGDLMMGGGINNEPETDLQPHLPMDVEEEGRDLAEPEYDSETLDNTPSLPPCHAS